MTEPPRSIGTIRRSSARTRSSVSPASKRSPRWARIEQRAAVEPGVAAATPVDALGEFVRIGIGRSDVALACGDHRFTDATWHNNLLFNGLMQAYLVWDQAAHRVIDEVELDTKSRAEPISRCR